MSNIESLAKNNSSNIILASDLADLTANASLAAYTDFANTNNPTYTPPALQFDSGEFNFIQRFTGFDDVAWGSGEEERYALLYQSSLQSDVYLVAFRGTSSAYDMILDLESATTTAFTPFNTTTHFPNTVAVGDGFYKIYATKNSSMTASLQSQLFTAINALPTPATQIYITGHSLGGALASLFTLDMAVSLPSVIIESITYASPRVGTANWQTAYNQTYALQNKTIRVCNSYDLVPKSPPALWPFDFKDVGNVFPVAFGLVEYHIDFPLIVLSWHALLNYQYVVSRATVNSPQIWTGQFVDQAHSSWEMQSYNPSTRTTSIEQSQNRTEVQQLVTEEQHTYSTPA